MSKEDEVFQSGERELKQAFEEVTTRNVVTILEFTKETRKLVRALEEKVLNLQNGMFERDKTIVRLQAQISVLQQKLYSGGS